MTSLPPEDRANPLQSLCGLCRLQSALRVGVLRIKLQRALIGAGRARVIALRHAAVTVQHELLRFAFLGGLIHCVIVA